MRHPLVLLCTILFAGTLSTPLTQAAFTDTAEDSLLYFQSHGIIQGYEDGSFRPNAPINRAEFIKILVENAHMTGTAFTPGCFSDIPTGAWYEQYVCIGKELQMIEGYPDGTFRPGNEVTNAEALKMVVGTLTEDQKMSLQDITTEKKEIQERMKKKYTDVFGHVPNEVLNNPAFAFKDIETDAWYYPYLLEGWRTGLIDAKKNFAPNTASTRGSVMEMVFRNILNIQMPYYTNCAQSFTLAACARDFFTIERTINELPIDTRTTKVTTASGSIFAVEHIQPELELRPLFVMEDEFLPNELVALIKADTHGKKSFIWWKEETGHHMSIEPSIFFSQQGDLTVRIRVYDYVADFANLDYFIDQEILQKIPLAG